MFNTQNAAPPWVFNRPVPAGGLIGVGFAAASDLMLIVTHDGRGVLDCITGDLVARDRNPLYPLDDINLTVEGIGPLIDSKIQIAGAIYGGLLPEQTQDGWRLVGLLTNSGEDMITLAPPAEIAGESACFSGFVPEVRVFGFSPTGRSFVIGTGAEVYTFAR